MGSGTDRYLMGVVDNLENLSGTLSLSNGYEGQMQSPEIISGVLSTPDNLEGLLSNATLRGIPVELRIEGTTLQWKYLDDDEWTSLIDISTISYETLQNLPQINGIELIGNKTFEDLGLTALSSREIESVLT